MKKKNIKYLLILFSIVCLVGLTLMGVSYSLWNMSLSQDTNNIITTTSECFNIELTNQSNNINLENAYPITNEKGKRLTPFTFTVKNTCDMFLSYTISLESLKESTLASKFINVMVNNEAVTRLSTYESTETVNEGSIEARVLAKGSLSKDDSNDYSLRLWIDYDTTMEDLDNETKVLKSKIVIKAVPSNWDPVSEGYTTLHDAILANEYQTSPEKAIERINAKGDADLTKSAPIIKWQSKISDDISSASVFKAASSMVNCDSYTKSLTENDTLMVVYTKFSFDTTNATYTLSNPIIVNPAELDYSSDTKYYFIQDDLQFSNNIYWGYSSTSGLTAYQILGASFKLENNYFADKYDANVYDLQVKKLTSENMEADNSDKGLYKGEDDYGTTYYYRGNVSNNYVKFADFYWKIIRINGDGSIRLLFNGDNNNDNISLSQFNSTRNNPAYGGYMYGKIGSSTYEEAYANTNDSTIKEIIDEWFKEHIVANNYAKYLENNVGFCGNRKVVSGDGLANNKETNYYSYTKYINGIASFRCTDVDNNFLENDYYTMKTADSGNKALTYPVGLITYDELIYSGMNRRYINNLVFTHSQKSYWTMTPLKYDKSYLTADVMIADNSGNINGWTPVSYNYYVRPVINLKANVKITGGIGTTNNPFVIETGEK